MRRNPTALTASGIRGVENGTMSPVLDLDFHCAPPFTNAEIAALGMRREPFRNSTHGSRPSRKSRQTVVRLTFNARAACAIDNSRRSPGSVAPSISLTECGQCGATCRGLPPISRLVVFLVMGESPFVGCLLFLPLPPKYPVVSSFGTLKRARADAMSSKVLAYPVCVRFQGQKKEPAPHDRTAKIHRCVASNRLISARSRRAVISACQSECCFFCVATVHVTDLRHLC